MLGRQRRRQRRPGDLKKKACAALNGIETDGANFIVCFTYLSAACMRPLSAVHHPNTQMHFAQLLSLIRPLKRGLTATEDDQQQIEAAVQQLEKLNPTPKPLASNLLSGRWRLEYTTSQVRGSCRHRRR